MTVRRKLTNWLLGCVCLLCAYHVATMGYERVASMLPIDTFLEAIRLILHATMGVLATLGWLFMAYSFFLIDGVGVLIGRYNAWKRKKRMKNNKA